MPNSLFQRMLNQVPNSGLVPASITAPIRDTLKNYRESI